MRNRISKFDGINPVIEEYVTEHPYSNVFVLQTHLYLTCGLRPSRSTIYRSLKSCKLTYKRAQRSRLKAELTDHPFYHLDDPYKDVISIDECHFQESDSPSYGWSQCGARVHRRKPNQYKRVSLLLAISKDDVLAAMLVKGSVKAETFIQFLRLLPNKAHIVLDNAPIHIYFQSSSVASVGSVSITDHTSTTSKSVSKSSRLTTGLLSILVRSGSRIEILLWRGLKRELPLHSMIQMRW